MLMVINDHESGIAEIDRGIDDSTMFDRWMVFGKRYLSADKLNFDEALMPQVVRTKYRGIFSIAQHDEPEPVLLSAAREFLLKENLDFAGVIEAFWYGEHAVSSISTLRKALALGSICKIPGSPFCCCPSLAEFYGFGSLGIALLGKNQNTDGDVDVLLPANTWFLLVNK